MSNEVVVVDDDLEMGRVIKDLLTYENISVTHYGSASEALVSFKKSTPRVLITDYKMKEIDGMLLLKKVQSEYPNIIVIMMTAYGSVETAIEAMKNGAYHYIVKPFKNEELVLLTKRALEKAKLIQENKDLKSELNKSVELKSIVGKSPAMVSVFELIKMISSASANVLITGESGSGKELVARAIHNTGPRKSKPFIPLNCTAIPEQLLESELFGHVKGSFTGAVSDKKGLFEEADGGTLFLDEIGDLNLSLQAKLLRVIQDKHIRAVGGSKLKKIDVRIIAATHRDLRVMAAEGKFREDLFYRLNVIPIRVPPLRERTEDIPLIVDSFIKRFSEQLHLPTKKLSPDAMTIMMSHTWPGNVRELENVIERALILSPGNTIEKSIILDNVKKESKNNFDMLQLDRPTLEKLEERYIKLILKEVNDKKDDAAKILGISRRTLYRKERLYGMISSNEPEQLEFHDEISI